MKTKLMFLDTETCGLNPYKATVDQIAGMVEVDGKIEKNFDIKFRPHEDAIIEETAYTFRGMTVAEVKQRTASSAEGCTRFLDICNTYTDKYNKVDKFIPVGYNLKFDMDMMNRWFLLHGDKWLGSYFFRPGIDVLSLALYALQKHRYKMIDFKQGTVARALGLKVDESRLHDALYDIELLREIYREVGGHIYSEQAWDSMQATDHNA